MVLLRKRDGRRMEVVQGAFSETVGEAAGGREKVLLRRGTAAYCARASPPDQQPAGCGATMVRPTHLKEITFEDIGLRQIPFFPFV